jgi:multiple sugar transport system substrate-binding protein
MIASGSKHPNEAWEYIKWITSQPVQNQYVADSLPVWKSSYSNSAVVAQINKAAGPGFAPVAEAQFSQLILRPQVTNYNAASQALRLQIQNALLGHTTPQAALNTAAKAFTSGGPPA